MKRPANAGKGLDGVVRCAPGYDNPASTLLEATGTEGGTQK
jgi:beta-lysine 5,6-aminomutase alpha subunit